MYEPYQIAYFMKRSFYAPPFTGLIADHSGIAIAFLIPLSCFAFITWFALHSPGRILPIKKTAGIKPAVFSKN